MVGAVLEFFMWWALAKEVAARWLSFFTGSEDGFGLKWEMGRVVVVGEGEISGKRENRERKHRKNEREEAMDFGSERHDISEKQSSVTIWLYIQGKK